MKRWLFLQVLVCCVAVTVSAQDRLWHVVMELVKAHPYSDISRFDNTVSYGCSTDVNDCVVKSYMAFFSLSRASLNDSLLDSLVAACNADIKNTRINARQIFTGTDSLSYAMQFDNGIKALVDIGQTIRIVIKGKTMEDVAQQPLDFSELKRVYAAWSGRDDVQKHPVSYWGKHGNFICFKGNGNGYTSGERCMKPNATLGDWMTFVSVMTAYMPTSQPVSVFWSGQEIFVCSNYTEHGWKDFFIASCKKDTLRFLHPTFSPYSLCIPKGWEWIDRYNGTGWPLKIDGKKVNNQDFFDRFKRGGSKYEIKRRELETKGSKLSVRLADANIERMKLAVESLRKRLDDDALPADKKEELLERLEILEQKMRTFINDN